MSHPIRCVVGLGNPGADYAKTRHNVGVWFVDFLAAQENVSLRLDKKLRGFVAEFLYQDQKCFLFKPATFMNESGLAVSAFTRFHKIDISEILVAHDELDFDAGIARLKLGGGHGGHNGLRDIMAHLSADFYRLRLGIGHPGDRDQVTDYVLGNPGRDDRIEIMKAIDESASVMPDLFSGKIQRAFHALHS
ncbi:MAG: aminoacyl-tRNA hydrolase [Gammaproteobacteria bacterium CG_4_10_14_0_8_um_filter_38_16]|nr:MAG: aminoacyl-tRNA hydrolase [Gammaproteobacteria bacterium CG_4_10_14_0_8_um_filter_38_16]PJA03916.1 MAG: aminoacyl-tRNA hydrolase [Gammaproteobacteria bacterium CG_4_10_14_0_2_um_filter_38_22]PJB09756.1 MAG: aminoacyl-tRNA hydrolase [Gammaproteobacteria bacterium CG_4_9_14_3_um_filter_38_9]